MKTRWLTAIYLAALTFAIFMMSRQEFRSLLGFLRFIPHYDKYIHFFAIGFLSMLLNTTLDCRAVRILGVRLMAGSFIIGLLMTVEEGGQLFLRNRVFDYWDLVADYLGIFAFGRLAIYIHEHPLLRTRANILLAQWWSKLRGHRPDPAAGSDDEDRPH